MGGTLFLLALFLAGMTLFTGLSWLGVMDRTGRWTLRFVNWARDRIDELQDYLASRQMRMERQEVVREEKKKIENRPPPRIEPIIKKVELSEREREGTSGARCSMRPRIPNCRRWHCSIRRDPVSAVIPNPRWRRCRDSWK